jgi:undecaprenyl-phosphate 4-deoxy-4-formamido-L-arabinose transferase
MTAYSVVIPVYNSAATLAELSDRVHTVMKTQGSFELLLVDDGSGDGSWKVLQELKKNHPETVRIVRLSKNFGQHNAITCGFTVSKGAHVITMDDDLQHPPEEIPKLIARVKETDSDVVYGIPKTRRHSAFRVAGSYFTRRSSNLMKGNTEGSSFRIIRRSVVEQVSSHHNNAMIFIDEIISWYTALISTVDVDHHARKKGKSGYTNFSLMRLYFDILINHSAFPLKMMTWIGFISSLITLFLGIVFIARKFLMKVPVGFTAQIVAILFSASILMMCMGIVGQYLYKLFLLQNRKPNFSIREQH